MPEFKFNFHNITQVILKPRKSFKQYVLMFTKIHQTTFQNKYVRSQRELAAIRLS